LITACFSREILDEYSEVLARPKFAFSAVEISQLMETLRRRGELLRAVPAHASSPDPGDDKFIECALAAEAEFLVTGNKRDFPEDLLRPTKVLGAAELLDMITIGM